MKRDDFLDLLRQEQTITGKTFATPWIFRFTDANLNGIGDINIADCTFNGSVVFENLVLEHRTIRFERCSFNGEGLIQFSNCTTYSLAFIDCSSTKMILYQGNIKDVYIKNLAISNGLRVYDTELENLEISADGNQIISLITLSSEHLQNVVIKSDSNVKNLALNNLRNGIFEGDFETVNVTVEKFKQIEFTSTTKKLVSNNKSEISHFVFTNGVFEGNLLLNDIKIKTLTLESLISSGGGIRMQDIDIENANFYSLGIKNFYWHQVHFLNELTIEQCDLQDLKIANVKWLQGKTVSDSFMNEPIPLFYQLIKSKLDEKQVFDGEEIKWLQDERDTYRQLKAASISNHNHIEALDFYKNEMRLYWKEIRINGGIKWSDRILVFLNRWVSDFGQSWVLPLVWLFSFHTLIYFWIINFDLTLAFFELNNGAGQYFELLNPVHKTPDYIKGFDVGLELILRVIDGFFIYHFVRATRKFGKV